jgi:hypothetical protein
MSVTRRDIANGRASVDDLRARGWVEAFLDGTWHPTAEAEAAHTRERLRRHSEAGSNPADLADMARARRAQDEVWGRFVEASE